MTEYKVLIAIRENKINPDYALDFRSLREHRKEPLSVNILKN